MPKQKRVEKAGVRQQNKYYSNTVVNKWREREGL